MTEQSAEIILTGRVYDTPVNPMEHKHPKQEVARGYACFS